MTHSHYMIRCRCVILFLFSFFCISKEFILKYFPCKKKEAENFAILGKVSIFVAEKQSTGSEMMTTRSFLDYLRYERNFSEKTILAYGKDLNELEEYFKSLDEDLEWETIDADVIRGWMESMVDRGNLPSTVNRRLSSVKSFFRFALSHGDVKKDPARMVDGMKKNKRLPAFVKDSDMELLLSKEMWQMDDFKDVAARMLILMFYETGMRLSELTSLDDAMIDHVNRQVKVTGKRDKQRVIPYGEELEQELAYYIKVRDASVQRRDDALFVTAKGRRMDGDAVRYRVKKNISRVCVQKKRSPHVLRHTFATTMLNHGAGLESVQKLLGHESVATTEIYTHTTFEKLKEIYTAAHPRR